MIRIPQPFIDSLVQEVFADSAAKWPVKLADVRAFNRRHPKRSSLLYGSYRSKMQYLSRQSASGPYLTASDARGLLGIKSSRTLQQGHAYLLSTVPEVAGPVVLLSTLNEYAVWWHPR